MLSLASRARPYFGAVVLTVVLLTAGGLYSSTRMPRAVYPEVTFPRIAIVARAPSLDLATMEVKVTRPLEEAVTTVIGVAQVRSKTIRGATELSIDFNPGTEMRYAKEDTWNRISAIRSALPADVDLTVEQMTPSIFPILSLVLTGGDTPTQLRDYAFYQLAPKIKNVPDVLYANVAGGDIREIEVEARPDDLLTAGLSAADLADQIGKLHLLQPVGRIERPPFAYQLLVNTQGTNAQQIEELVIATKNNQPLHVRDVADVRVLHQDRVLSIGFQGRDAVVITVFRRLGGNAVNVTRDVRDLLAKHKPPGNIEATIAYDQAAFVTTAVDNVRDAIIVGGIFSVLILLGFLRSWRATLISALAIPTTLAITLLLLYWTGATLNLMSLGGLAVAIGLIIDDTVVVIENIARHLVPSGTTTTGTAPAADPVDAASSEITGAVIGSTLTTVLVFVPLAFIVGVYGQFFASLSWALSAAVLVSMVISLTLVPVCAAKFLGGRPMPAPGRLYRLLEHFYDLGLAGAMRFPWVTLGVSFAAVGLGLILYTGIPDPRPAPVPAAKPVAAKEEAAAAPEKKGTTPRAPLVKGLQTGLMPAMDEGAFILDYYAPSGTPLERTVEMARQLEEILSKNPDVEAYVRRTGSENGIFATQTFRGDISVILRSPENDPVHLLTKTVRPKLDDTTKEGKALFAELKKPDGREKVRRQYRRRSASQVMEEVDDQIKDAFSEHQLKFELVPIMEDELNDLSGASRPIEVKLFGPDQKVLRELADKLGDVLEEKGKGRGLAEVNSHVNEGNPDLMVRVDGVRAAKYGLTPQEVQRQLQAMFLGQVATQVRESAVRITDVRVRYPDRIRFGGGSFDPQRLLDQWLLLPDTAAAPATATTSASAGLAGPARAVRLSAVARVEPVRTPDEEWRENQQPAIFITAELKPEEAGLNSVAADINRWMADFPLPSKEYHWDLGGHYLRQVEAFDSFKVVIVVAILLVFIMLAFQFRSVVLPLLIFLTQPLSLVSGLFALWLTSTPLNVSSGMGLILLIGLDMKNGILLVEYIQQLRAEGMALRPALMLAGRTRFRPILMTSLAAILGMLPLALGIGPGAQMQQPLAIVVIGGLTANMLFTRMIIPVGYLVLEGGGETAGSGGAKTVVAAAAKPAG
jgi:multidrug efflux pump subunit AcrB